MWFGGQMLGRNPSGQDANVTYCRRPDTLVPRRYLRGWRSKNSQMVCVASI